MTNIYLIKHISQGYYEKSTGRYRGYLFADRYVSEFEAKLVIYNLNLTEVEIVELYISE